VCLPVAPFKVEKEWKHCGLSCAVVMAGKYRFRCGYVRVPPSHPAYRENYELLDVDVHGGLTFGVLEPCAEHEDGQGYWLGFDCAHSGDEMYDPAHPVKYSDGTLRNGRGHYWTEAETVLETERLAEQLAAMH
jgi:hypothetical protein